MGSTPQMSRHVRDRYETLDGLLAAGELVQGVVDHPGWAHLMGVIDAEVSQIDRKLDGHTTPLTQAEYALAHGRRGGLKSIEEAAHAIVQTAAVALADQRARHEGAGETALEVT